MRREGDGINVFLTQVSIHASVKDATNIKTTFDNFFVGFNPRIRKGCD